MANSNANFYKLGMSLVNTRTLFFAYSGSSSTEPEYRGKMVFHIASVVRHSISSGLLVLINHTVGGKSFHATPPSPAAVNISSSILIQVEEEINVKRINLKFNH